MIWQAVHAGFGHFQREPGCARRRLGYAQLTDPVRIDAVTPDGLVVRRALDADPAYGQRRWTARPFLYADYRTPSRATRSPAMSPGAAP
jgi:hypothetical protein